MFKNSKVCFLVLICFLFVMCNQKDGAKKDDESILEGSTTILVDETLIPIVEDQVAVFESKYPAHIKIVPLSETELMLSLFNQKAGIAILTRDLSLDENNIFKQKKITPKITRFAQDAIVFISNKSNNDTLIALEDVIDFMKGKRNSRIKGLVFDNPNSSTSRYINRLAGVKEFSKKDVYSFETNQDVIKFVAKNEGMIGVVGLSWLSQPTLDMQKHVNNVNVLSVKGLKGKDYCLPTQNNIAEGIYPLARNLFVINGQGYSGLGMGFASFVAGDIGQRIVLKSGLLPVVMPGRKIIIRSEINNETNKN